MRTLRKTIVAFMLALCILPLVAEEGTKLTYDDLKDSLTLNNPDILQAIEDHRTASLDVKDAHSGRKLCVQPSGDADADKGYGFRHGW